MAKKDLVKDSLVKLTNVFPDDLYIVHNYYVIAGQDSETKNDGYYFCILEPDVKKAWDELYPSSPIIYIPSIRAAKENLKSVEIIDDDYQILLIEDDIKKRVERFHNDRLIMKPLPLTDEEISILFDENRYISLFEHEESMPSITISKSLFPLVTKSTLNKLVFAYDPYQKDESVMQFLLIYDHPYFQLHMRYLFLPL